MPKVTVEVEFVTTRTKEISVYARDEQEAEEKAVSIVEGWDGVESAQATNVTED